MVRRDSQIHSGDPACQRGNDVRRRQRRNCGGSSKVPEMSSQRQNGYRKRPYPQRRTKQGDPWVTRARLVLGVECYIFDGNASLQERRGQLLPQGARTSGLVVGQDEGDGSGQDVSAKKSQEVRMRLRSVTLLASMEGTAPVGLSSRQIDCGRVQVCGLGSR